MEELTSRQQAILNYIRTQVRDRGYPPTVRELTVELGVKSSSTVHDELSRLVAKGLLERDPCQARAIRLVD